MRAVAAVLAVASLVACGPADEAEWASDESTLTTAEKQAIVDALNDARTTVPSLRAAGVSSTAAAAILRHRDGADGVSGTRDDDRFDTFAEVDAVSGVGPATLERLRGYAVKLGLGGSAGGGSWEGVAFTPAELDATLELVNGATKDELVADGRIASRTADAIVAARPISTIAALAKLAGIGPTTLARLKAFAGAWRRGAKADLNAATEAELETCNRVGPALAAALVAYRRTNGAFESYEEALALPTLGWSVPVSEATIEALRACTSLAGERPRAEATIAQILADPGRFEGSIVTVRDAVLTADLNATAASELQAFDFARWNHATWNAEGVPASARIGLTVELRPEMHRRASTSFELRAARDTKLNRVHLSALVELRAGAPRLRVRSQAAAGRDYVQVVSRWMRPERVGGLSSLWSRENGVLRTTEGAYVNLVPAALLNVHPAVLFHSRRTGEAVDVGREQTGYDSSVSRYVDDGQALYRRMLEAWSAAGRPSR